MGLIFPDPPQAPNPIVTAGAQTAQNLGTAITGSYLNNYNQVSPTGSLTYEPTSTYRYNDPLTGVGYDIPRWTATQSLSPAGQRLQTTNEGTSQTLAELGNYEANSLSAMLRDPSRGLQASFNNAPAAGSIPGSGFDGAAYLRANPDVAQFAQQNGLNPLAFAQQHYQQYGLTEGRAGEGTAIPGTQYDINFDAASYLRNNPDVAQLARQNGLNPASFAQQHYQNYGMGEGRSGGLDTGSIQMGLQNRGLQQTTFGDAGDITRSYGPADNFSADRQRVEESLYQRINPQLQQDRDRLRQQLADQGIQYGTEAYDRAIAAADRQTTDARLAVTAQGGQEQQRMMDMAAQRAGFQNAAQKQAYDQALGRGQFANQAQIEQFQKDVGAGTFANQAQKDAFTQAASRAQFNNAAQAQELARQNAQFNAQNAARGQYLTEQAALRNAPINEILALQSGSQVQQPNFGSGGNNQIANTDVAGIIAKNFDQQLDIYKQQSGTANQIIGGLFGLAGNAAQAGATVATKSDRRVKKNIHRVGTVFAARKHDEPKKLPIYSFEYKDGHEDSGAKRHIGPMAQDVEKIDPKAVTTKKGVKHIYPRKVMGDILRVA